MLRIASGVMVLWLKGASSGTTFNAGRFPLMITVCRVLGCTTVDWSALGGSELVCAYPLAATAAPANITNATLRIPRGIANSSTAVAAPKRLGLGRLAALTYRSVAGARNASCGTLRSRYAAAPMCGERATTLRGYKRTAANTGRLGDSRRKRSRDVRVLLTVAQSLPRQYAELRLWRQCQELHVLGVSWRAIQ